MAEGKPVGVWGQCDAFADTSTPSASSPSTEPKGQSWQELKAAAGRLLTGADRRPSDRERHSSRAGLGGEESSRHGEREVGDRGTHGAGVPTPASHLSSAGTGAVASTPRAGTRLGREPGSIR